MYNTADSDHRRALKAPFNQADSDDSAFISINAEEGVDAVKKGTIMRALAVKNRPGSNELRRSGVGLRKARFCWAFPGMKIFNN